MTDENSESTSKTKFNYSYFSAIKKKQKLKSPADKFACRQTNFQTDCDEIQTVTGDSLYLITIKGYWCGLCFLLKLQR
jgi:hypothetical protein